MRKRYTMFDYMETYWASPSDAYWRHAEEIAQEIVVVHKTDLVSPPVGRVRLVKLRVEPGFGVIYFMTIEVTGKNGTITSYAVKVYRRPSDLPYKIASFDKIPGSETKSWVSDESNVTDKKASSSRKGKKRAALSDGKSSSIITRSGKTSDEKASSTIKGNKRAALSDGKSSSIITRSGKTSDEKASSTIKGNKRAALSDGKSSSIITRSGKTSDESFS